MSNEILQAILAMDEDQVEQTPSTVEPAMEQVIDTTAEQGATEPEATPPTNTETTEPADTAAVVPSQDTAALSSMPPLDAPAVRANQPVISYKVAFGNNKTWAASTDGGQTNADTGVSIIGGAPCDMALEVSKGTRHDGYDARLRIAFIDGDSNICELNLNSLNVSREGEIYVTSPVRSILGALLAISENTDDMGAFCNGARFVMKAGNKGGIFVDLDVVIGDRWVAFSSPANYTRSACTGKQLMEQLNQIKHRFREQGLLLSNGALFGDLDGLRHWLDGTAADAAVETTAQAV